MTELEQEISAFRSILNLNKHLQNGDVTETEEPPRNKCVEIEENDGRAPEYILFFLNRAHLPIQNVERKEEINDQGRCCKGFECCPTPQTPTHFTLVDLTLPSTSVPISSQPRSATLLAAPPLYPSPIETLSTSTTQNSSVTPFSKFALQRGKCQCSLK